jgi:Serine/threonine protein kinase
MRQSGSGSITQWMFTCTCSLAQDKEIQDDIDLCMKCGKRIGAGRDGSFTQFIFRASLCACAEPSPNKSAQPSQEVYVAQRHQLLTNLELNFDESDESGEQEISLDANSFPIDRYKPLAELGRGAAGRVHLCRDRLLNKLVAVKSLNRLSTDQLVSFQLEAKANSMLSHKNIIKVLDFGASEYGCPFMVMQFVNGISMEQFLATYGPMSEILAARTFAQVCEALNYVHAKQVFHRDLKPSNILLTPRPETPDIWDVRLIDFGVAGVKKDQQPTVVQGQTVVGTPTYMSPDQLLNRPYDSRSETYSIGCVLFEALSGRPPFLGETVLNLVSRHANEAPPTMAEASGLEFSSDLESIVAKALSKDPDKRYQTARELQVDLLAAVDSLEEAAAERLLEEEESEEMEPGSASPSSPDPAANRSKMVIVGVVWLVCLVLVVVTYSLWSTITAKFSAVDVKNKPHPTDLVFKSESDDEGTLSVENGWHVLKGKWTLRDFRKLALKGPILKLHFLHADVDWRGLKALKGMPVTDITVEETECSPSNFKHLANLKKLNYLVLRENDFRGKALEALSGLDSLETFVIEDSQIDAEGWAAMAKVKSLRKINAADTKGWSGKDLKPICELPLTALDVQNTELGDEGMECISAVRTIASLEVNDCHLTDDGAKYLGRMTNLQNLYIMTNGFTDRSVMYLKNLKMLTTLKAQGTTITQAGVKQLLASCPHMNKDVLSLGAFGVDVDKLTDHETLNVQNRF